MTGKWLRPIRFVPLSLALALCVAASAQPQPSQTTASLPAAFEGGPGPCEELPQGRLSEEQLRQLVPDSAPGRVFIRWRTETQEDNYGFNIYRSKSAEGPYEKVNSSIIPGEGTTNIPISYCYVDKPLPRGEAVYYYIESVSTSGVAETIAETKGTRVTVKTVEQERQWLRKKALEAAGLSEETTTATQSATTQTTK